MESIFPQRKAIHATEYFLSGDYPKSSWDRLNWKPQENQNSHQTQNFSDCQIENLCVVLNPSDLKTFRIEFIGEEPKTSSESVKPGFHKTLKFSLASRFIFFQCRNAYLILNSKF